MTFGKELNDGVSNGVWLLGKEINSKMVSLRGKVIGKSKIFSLRFSFKFMMYIMLEFGGTNSNKRIKI